MEVVTLSNVHDKENKQLELSGETFLLQLRLGLRCETARWPLLELDMNYKCVFAVCLLLTLVTSWSFPVVSCLWFTLIMISFYSRLRSAFEFSLSKSTFFLLFIYFVVINSKAKLNRLAIFLTLFLTVKSYDRKFEILGKYESKSPSSVMHQIYYWHTTRDLTCTGLWIRTVTSLLLMWVTSRPASLLRNWRG